MGKPIQQTFPVTFEGFSFMKPWNQAFDFHRCFVAKNWAASMKFLNEAWACVRVNRLQLLLQAW